MSLCGYGDLVQTELSQQLSEMRFCTGILDRQAMSWTFVWFEFIHLISQFKGPVCKIWRHLAVITPANIRLSKEGDFVGHLKMASTHQPPHTVTLQNRRIKTKTRM